MQLLNSANKDHLQDKLKLFTQQQNLTSNDYTPVWLLNEQEITTSQKANGTHPEYIIFWEIKKNLKCLNFQQFMLSFPVKF